MKCLKKELKLPHELDTREPIQARQPTFCEPSSTTRQVAPIFNITESEEKQTPYIYRDKPPTSNGKQRNTNISTLNYNTSVQSFAPGLDAKTMQFNKENFFTTLDSSKEESMIDTDYMRVSGEKQLVKNFTDNYIPYGIWPEMTVPTQTRMRCDYRKIRGTKEELEKSQVRLRKDLRE